MPTATALSNLPTGDDRVCVDNWLETHVVPKPRGRSSSVRDCISGRLSDIQEDLCYLSFRGAEDNCDRRQPCRRKGLDYRHPVSEFEEAACKMMGEMHEGHGQCEPKPLRASPADCEENQLKPELRKKLKVMGAALLGLATLVLRN